MKDLRQSQTLPMSRAAIQSAVERVWSAYQVDLTKKIDIVRITEWEVKDKFHIVSEDELRDYEALTETQTGDMYMREDIYVRACNGEPRARFTMGHELAHFCLHKNQDQNKRLARDGFGAPPIRYLQPGQKILCIYDPEWQASAFSGEMLMPAMHIRHMTIEEIILQYGVSRSAARYQKMRVT